MSRSCKTWWHECTIHVPFSSPVRVVNTLLVILSGPVAMGILCYFSSNDVSGFCHIQSHVYRLILLASFVIMWHSANHRRHTVGDVHTQMCVCLEPGLTTLIEHCVFLRTTHACG